MAGKGKRIPLMTGLKSPKHIGKIIQKHIKDRRLSQASWARAVGVQPKTIVGYFKKPTMQISTLFTICQVLKFNFFRDIANELPAEYPPFSKNPLEDENAELKKENEKLQLEVNLLKEIVMNKK